jgi:hypothetical protein
VSSIKYNVFKEGKAIKISIKVGSKVQIVSTSCPSVIYLLKFFVIISEIIRYRVMTVTIVKIIIA